MNTLKGLIGFVLISCALASGCANTKTPPGFFSGEEIIEVKSFASIRASAALSGKVDILWVIDNSGTMYARQQALAANLNQFSTIMGDLDICNRVIPTDADRASPATIASYPSFCWSPLQPNGMTQAQAIQRFQQDVMICNLGGFPYCNGNGSERVYESTWNWLDRVMGFNPLNNTLNSTLPVANAFRPDALMLVVIITDEVLQRSTNTVNFHGVNLNPATYFTAQRFYQSLVDYREALNPAVPGENSVLVSAIYAGSQEHPPYMEPILPDVNTPIEGGFGQLASAVGGDAYSGWEINCGPGQGDTCWASIVSGVVNQIDGLVLSYNFTTQFPAQPNSVVLEVMQGVDGPIIMTFTQNDFRVEYRDDETRVFVKKSAIDAATHISSDPPNLQLQIRYYPADFS